MSTFAPTQDAPPSLDPASFAESLRMMDLRRAHARFQQRPGYLAGLAEAATFYADVVDGRRPVSDLVEALSTSDFPVYFSDIAQRQVLGAYRAYAPTWQNFMRKTTVKDFRTVKRIAFDGLDGRFDLVADKLTEGASVRENNDIDETEYSIAVDLYAKAFAINWRALVNNDLASLIDAPSRLALGARRTEEYIATSLYVGANGPHASLYTSGVNQLTGNPVLSLTSLAAAMVLLSQQTQPNGEPIDVGPIVHLVVPMALSTTAMNLANALQFETNKAGGDITGLANSSGVETRLIVQNWISRGIKVHIAPYIPTIASSSNGNTSWFVFTDTADRSSLEMATLEGMTEPIVLAEAGNTATLSGQLVPEYGNFDTMERRWKVMFTAGGARRDGRGTVASSGAGS